MTTFISNRGIEMLNVEEDETTSIPTFMDPLEESVEEQREPEREDDKCLKCGHPQKHHRRNHGSYKECMRLTCPCEAYQ